MTNTDISDLASCINLKRISHDRTPSFRQMMTPYKTDVRWHNFHNALSSGWKLQWEQNILYNV